MHLLRSNVVLSVCLLYLTIFSTIPLWASDKQPLRVGVAKVDITPSDLKDLNAWGGSFTAVHDPIFVRVLVLDNGVNVAAVVTLDIVETGDTTPLRRHIESKVGIPADHVMITSSHAHSAPRLGSVTPGGLAHGASSATEAYTSAVYDKIVAGLKQARASAQPARFGLGTGYCDINVYRSGYTPQGWQGVDHNGPSDNTVWVLKFETLSGEPIALLFDYAVHSAVALGTGELSGDLAGAAERYVEARYDNKIVALYSMGPAGDQNPVIMPPVKGVGSNEASASTKSGPPMQLNIDPPVVYDAVNSMGTVLGAEVVRAANLIEKMTSLVRIEADERVVPCPVRKGINQEGLEKQADVSSIDLHLSLILINNVALTGVSGEVATNIYWHLKKESPLTNTIMLTLCNDRVGYIVEDAAYDTPSHQTNGTPIARGYAENGIVNGLVEMIDRYQ